MGSQNKLLVTGASGQLGQMVLNLLIKQGHKNLIATTRHKDKLQTFSDQGVDVREADFNQPESLTKAFAGASRLLLISTDAIGARVEQHKNAINAAKAAGVKHIIYTSWPKAETSAALVSADHIATENLIKQSGLSYTILRNSLYAENLLGSLSNAFQMGTFYGATGNTKAAYVSKKDCALAAAGALSHEDYSNKILDVTGPQAYSYEEIVKMASQEVGKNIPYVDLSPEDLKQGLTKSGLPENWADLFVSFDVAIKNGDVEKISDAALVLTGQVPQNLKEFLKENKNLIAKH